MTTIITVVVVALVFFVTVCIVGLMIWKREAEMRTDSIKAIEHNVEEMLYELTGSSSGEVRRRIKRDEAFRGEDEEPRPVVKDKPERDRFEKEELNEPDEKKNQDPSEWARAESDREKTFEDEKEAEKAEKLMDNITVFEPAVQYTSFDRGGDPSERDGKHGLRWKEIHEPKETEIKQEQAQPLEEQSQLLEAQMQPPEEESQAPEPAFIETQPPEPLLPEEPEIAETQPPEPEIPEPQRFEPEEPELLPPEEPEILPPEEPEIPQPDEFGLMQPEELEAPQPIFEAEIPQRFDAAAAPPQEADPQEKQENDEGGRFAKLLKRHKKSKTQPAQNVQPEREQRAPQQETYQTIEDLLKDYISEPHSGYDDNEYEEEPETRYHEPIKPGYDVGKSGRKYTAAELDALIKE